MNKIRPFMGKSIIKILVGQRRVGKSFLLYQIMDEIKKVIDDLHIVYINKEDMRFDTIKNASDLNDYLKAELKPDSFNAVFIDEVQEINSFEKAIRSLLLRDNTDIYVTGSNAEVFSSNISTLLGGRTVTHRVHSLSYPEFLQFHELNDTTESFDRYLRWGGLPYIKHLPLDDDVIAEYLDNIVQTIIYRDVVARNNIRSTAFLEQLLRYLADTTGSLFSAKNISDYLKSQRINISHIQVGKFIEHLSDAFILEAVKRFDIKGKRIFERGEKYYFEDLGIRNALVGYKPGDRSKLLEAVVYNHLRFLGYTVYVGKWEQYEIDFVAEKSNERKYIQVTWRLDQEKTIEREFGNLLSIEDNYPKMVISESEDYPQTYKGVQHVNIRSFLHSMD